MYYILSIHLLLFIHIKQNKLQTSRNLKPLYKIQTVSVLAS